MESSEDLALVRYSSDHSTRRKIQLSETRDYLVLQMSMLALELASRLMVADGLISDFGSSDSEAETLDA